MSNLSFLLSLVQELMDLIKESNKLLNLLLGYLSSVGNVKKCDMTDSTLDVARVCERLASFTDARIVLLREPEVIQWLSGDTSFLPPIDAKNKSADCKKRKVQEDACEHVRMQARVLVCEHARIKDCETKRVHLCSE